MSEYKSFKKADLAAVARKMGLPVRAKDTKQLLLEKIEVFVEEQPERAKELVEADIDVVAVEANSDDDALVLELELELAEEDDDENDKDYNAPPPIDVREWVVDPAIALFERSLNRALTLLDRVGITTLEFSEDLRENLSRTVTLNFLALAAELALWYFTFVTFVPFKHNGLVPRAWRHLQWLFPTPDVTYLGSAALSSFGWWLALAVAAPMVAAYYFNFSRRVVVVHDEDGDETQFVVRIYKYDPFVFAVARLLVLYFVKNSLVPHWDCSLLQRFFTLFGQYQVFVAGLGTFPYVIGAANVAIGLYSQFEDY